MEQRGAPARRGRRASARAARSALRTLGLVAFVVLLTLGSVRGSAAGPLPPVAPDDGITVINVPPQFSGFSSRTQDGLNYIDVVVSDYNAWSDIFRVSVDVLDDLRAPVAEVAFQQYPDNVTLTRQPQFTEPLGSYLVRTLSSATVDVRPVTVEQRTQMLVTFVLSPVRGTWVSVTATDLGGLEAFAEVEYAANFFGGLPWVPAIFVAAFASVVAVIVVGRRIRRDLHGE